MKTIAIFFGMFIGFVGIYLWSMNHGVRLPQAHAQTVGVAATSTPVTVDGIVLLDASHPGPPTPYLLYENGHHDFEARILKFDRGRGCDVYAGDLPCASAAEIPSVPVTAGERVRVTGTFVDQRLWVETTEPIERSSDDMLTFTVRTGEEATTLGMQVEVRAIAPKGGSGCSVFLGCLGSDTPLATLYIHDAKRGRETLLAPGMLETTPYGVVALVGISSDQQVATILIARSGSK